MQAKPARKRWTYAEFARLPDREGARQEVICDELVVTPAPSLHHQRIAGRLFVELFQFVENERLGEVFPAPLDVLLGEGDYLEPDIVFVRAERSGDLLSDRGVEGPPDLVVEILSPATEARDRGIKLDRYAQFGVAEYWIVDPDAKSIEVYDLKGESTNPTVYRQEDLFQWTPPGAAGCLVISLPTLFEGG
jgi:Uma2 family endonuclease